MMNMHGALSLLFIIFLGIFPQIAFSKELPQELPDPLSSRTAKKKTDKKTPMTKEERLNAKKNSNSKKSESENANESDEKSGEVPALEKKIIGKIGKWTALRANPKDKIVCYAVLYADKTTQNTPNATKEKAYIAIHYFAEGRVRFSAFVGHNILSNRSVNISIDSIQHKMNSHGAYAIAESATHDEIIFQSLGNAEKMMIRSDGDNYSYSIDFYNIEYFTEVLQLLQTNCDSTTNNSSFKGLVPTKKDLKRL